MRSQALRTAGPSGSATAGRRQLRVSCVAAPPNPARTPASTGAVSGEVEHASLPACGLIAGNSRRGVRGGSVLGRSWVVVEGPAFCPRAATLLPGRRRPLAALVARVPPPVPADLIAACPGAPLVPALLAMQVKRAMTMTEKILAKHSDKPAVLPGDNVWTNVDKLLTHDVCGPGTFGIFQKEFGENAQVRRWGQRLQRMAWGLVGWGERVVLTVEWVSLARVVVGGGGRLGKNTALGRVGRWEVVAVRNLRKRGCGLCSGRIQHGLGWSGSENGGDGARYVVAAAALLLTDHTLVSLPCAFYCCCCHGPRSLSLLLTLCADHLVRATGCC